MDFAYKHSRVKQYLKVNMPGGASPR
jgi:hypothetical protein